MCVCSWGSGEGASGTGGEGLLWGGKQAAACQGLGHPVQEFELGQRVTGGNDLGFGKVLLAAGGEPRKLLGTIPGICGDTFNCSDDWGPRRHLVGGPWMLATLRCAGLCPPWRMSRETVTSECLARHSCGGKISVCKCLSPGPRSSLHRNKSTFAGMLRILTYSEFARNTTFM